MYIKDPRGKNWNITHAAPLFSPFRASPHANGRVLRPPVNFTLNFMLKRSRCSLSIICAENLFRSDNGTSSGIWFQLTYRHNKIMVFYLLNSKLFTWSYYNSLMRVSGLRSSWVSPPDSILRILAPMIQSYYFNQLFLCDCDNNLLMQIILQLFSILEL